MRFAGEPQAVHVLCYGITPEDHEWLQAHNDSVEACAAYLQEHGITSCPRASLLRGRGAADGAPPPPPGTAVPDLGDAQRLARQGAQPAGVRLHRDPRRHRHRRLRRSRRNRHRPHVHRDPSRGHPAGVPGPRARRARRGPRRPGQGGQVDPRRDGAGDPQPRPRRGDERPDPAAVLQIVERVMREGDVRRGRTGTDLGPDDARALLRAWLASMEIDRPSTRRAARTAPGGRAQPSRPLPPRAAHPRAQAGPGRARDRGATPRRPLGTSAATPRRCSMPASRHPVRRRGGVPRAREVQADALGRRPAPGRARRRRAGRDARGHAHASSRSASAASRATRSR